MNEQAQNLADKCIRLDLDVQKQIVDAKSLITVQYYDQLRDIYMTEGVRRLGFCTKQQCCVENYGGYVSCLYDAICEASNDISDELGALKRFGGV